MNVTQAHNLAGFTILFVVDFGIQSISPDYLEEKYDFFIGVDVTKPRLDSEPDKYLTTLDIYQNRWGACNDKIKTILRYIFEICQCVENRNLKLSNMVNIFNKYIGDSDKISNNKLAINGLHPVTRTKVLEPFLKNNIRHLKLLAILNE